MPSEVGSSVYLDYYRATDAIWELQKIVLQSLHTTTIICTICLSGPGILPQWSQSCSVTHHWRWRYLPRYPGQPQQCRPWQLNWWNWIVKYQIGTYTVTNNVYACGNLIITGFVDGPLVGGQPKAIEFYAIEDIADLSIYGLGVANNGGGSDGIEDVFPTIFFVPKGSFIYAAVNGVDFRHTLVLHLTIFSLTSKSMAMMLLNSSVVAMWLMCLVKSIKAAPDLHGNTWMAGFTENNQNIAGNYFNVNDWIYGGVNVLDNTTTNATAPTPFPLGTFTTNATPICPPNTFSQTILIGDNRLPQVVCPPNQTIILSPGENVGCCPPPKPEVIDNCAGDPVINQTGGPFREFCSLKTILRWPLPLRSLTFSKWTYSMLLSGKYSGISLSNHCVGL